MCEQEEFVSGSALLKRAEKMQMIMKTHLVEEGRGSYPVLPENMFRGQLEGLISDVSSYIGLSDGLLKSLLTMIRSTRPSDWTDASKEPVCCRMQSDLANELGKTDRALRNDEEMLQHKFGFLEKRVSANGSRRCSGEDYRQGLVFSGLIECTEDLMRLRDQMQAERRSMKTLKLKCSALKRQLKEALIEIHPRFPDDDALCDVRDAFLALPRRYTNFKNLEALEAHFVEVSALLDCVEKSKKRLQMQHHTSGTSEVDFRRYIQDTTQEPSVFCNENVHKLADAKPSDIISEDTSPNGSVSGNEKNDGLAKDGGKHKDLSWLTPMRLYYLASEEFRIWLSVHQKDKSMPDHRDFVFAAIDRMPELGIHGSAWTEAAEEMGDFTAALCVLVIDANRNHPINPVASPGGLLRDLTRRNKRGQLNIYGSLMGLIDRGQNA
ncbi:MAG: replication initiation protein RepC [Pseudoruegeria sp.]